MDKSVYSFGNFQLYKRTTGPHNWHVAFLPKTRLDVSEDHRAD